MSRLKELTSILKRINDHPLAGKHKIRSYGKFVLWQVSNFIDSRERKVVFTEKTFLLAKKSMKGATGNIYLGLHEFSDMGFLLHFLRKEDMFFDVGANIGSYTVLASGHAGACTIAFEPIPSTFKILQKNIKLNKIDTLVKALNVGAGSEAGNLVFTGLYDSENHVVSKSESVSEENSFELPVVTIDEIAYANQVPVLIKIDVEGFETEVLKGMKSILKDDDLKAVIIELNGSGNRYGYDENKIHQSFIVAGFNAYEYEPISRNLRPINEHGHLNTLYLRDISFIKERILFTEKISVFSEYF
jgi:FkbM family methyltransferase